MFYIDQSDFHHDIFMFKHVCFVDMVLPKLKYPVLYTVMYVLLLDVSKAFDKVTFNNYVI